ncbi:hypothetical protein [uncultured Dysgonomonas sp.]|uniref:hypothetical protein n=1 Tax=uncultured Dysgonomonas sp. TaxID=206096 RepID=UPI000AAB12D0|nr:hypothetical protein [uncultured Dysgonomonas sp.]
MRLFSKNKSEAVRRSVIRSVDKTYRKTQTGWVKLMERYTKNFERRSWIIALVIYALCAISLCAYLILSAIR